jgi:hypothetical protein
MAGCNVYEDGSWYCWYDDGSEEFGNANGDVVDQNLPGGSGFNWNALAQSGIAAATTVLSSRGYPVTPCQPVQTYPGAIPGVQASAGVTPKGIGTSLNISTNTLMLIAGGILLFMLGTKRGR